MTTAAIDWETFWATSRHVSWFEVGMCACLVASSIYSLARILAGRAIDRETVWSRAFFLLACALGVAYKLFDSLDVAILGYLTALLFAFVDAALSSRAKRSADDRRLLDELSDSQTHGGGHRHSRRHSDGGSSEHSHRRRRGWSGRSHSRHSGGERSDTEKYSEQKEPVYDDPLSDDGE